jgi:PleD family two-component response regulator
MSHNYCVDYSYNKKSRLNILIVDDDTNSLDLFKEILELHGHIVTTLDEGVKCISKCIDNKFDIIFLDYHIGDIDGVELADCLKDVLKTESLIFAYTGDQNPNSIQKFKDVGMNGVFFKPINMNIINNFISTLETNKKINKQTNSVIYF